jgi:hypothetical protein
MWMLTFSLLPLMALAYIGWHVWCLLPLPGAPGFFRFCDMCATSGANALIVS